MIKNQNRSKWFGASDTSTIMGNWETETFKNWWAEKLGFSQDKYKSWTMDCGNIMEIPIIRAIERQEGLKIKIGRHPYYNVRLRLRCNYDGLRKFEVVEIKTTGKGFKNAPKKYWQQCQVLMYRKKKKKTALYQYIMLASDYLKPYFPKIDPKRLTRHEIQYDEDFIVYEYLPRLRYLAMCLRKKKFPRIEEYVQNYSRERERPIKSIDAGGKPNAPAIKKGL